LRQRGVRSGRDLGRRSPPGTLRLSKKEVRGLHRANWRKSVTKHKGAGPQTATDGTNKGSVQKIGPRSQANLKRGGAHHKEGDTSSRESNDRHAALLHEIGAVPKNARKGRGAEAGGRLLYKPEETNGEGETFLQGPIGRDKQRKGLKERGWKKTERIRSGSSKHNGQEGGKVKWKAHTSFHPVESTPRSNQRERNIFWASRRM